MPRRPLVSKVILRGGRIVLTFLVAAYVFRRVDWTTLGDVLRLTDPAMLAAAFAVQGCSVTLASSRWQMLLANQGIRLGWFQTARLTLIGMFFSSFLLGNVSGDTAKFVGTLRHAPDRKTRLVISLVQDRIIGLGGLLLLLAGFIGWQHAKLGTERSLRTMAHGVLAACATFVLLAGILWILHRPPAAKRWNGTWDWVAFRFGTLGELFPKAVFFPALALSLANHAMVISAGFLVAHALGLAITFPVAGIVLGFTALALSLPITVAGLGVRDGMLLWLLGEFGFKSAGSAISLSACLLGLNLCWAAGGAVAFYWPAPNDGDKQ